ncbi:MAG TPA: CheR family methyltransferase [Spirochaetales bacterium]|nr:CheR family methyltransferase [Spirochaetales bacterium]
MSEFVLGLPSLVAWIESETGLAFPDVHHDTIRRAASLRCSQLGVSAMEYQELLASDHSERTSFLNGILIGETYFFRDERQFSILANTVLPKLMMENEKVSLWSATCASGEEAISIIAVAEHVKTSLALSTEYKVLASDLNQDAIKTLVAGRYSQSSFRSDGKRWHGLLERLGAMEGDTWLANKISKRHLETRHLNLLTGELPPKESLDVVFFRNTLVYMKQDKKDAVIEKVVATIKPGGFLFLASPEIPSVRHPLLESVEREGGFFFLRLAEAKKKSVSVKGFSKTPTLVNTIRSDTFKASAFVPTPSPVPSKQSLDTGPRQASRLELDAAIQLASTWSRGSDSEAYPSERVSGFARSITTIVQAIQENRFSAALEMNDVFEKAAGENYVSIYLRALVLKHRGQDKEAVELWEKARLYCERFWPALFQAGMAQKQSNPERCKKLMTDCLETMSMDGGMYFILLEGFDSAYYRHMASSALIGLQGISS